MKPSKLKIATCTLAASIAFLSIDMSVLAVGNNTILPSAGIDYMLGDHTASLKDLQEENKVKNPSFDNKSSDSEKTVSTPLPTVTIIPTPEPQEEVKEEKKIEETKIATSDKTIKEKGKELDNKREEEGFKSLVIAKVHDYVNVRSIPSEDGDILGKLYDKSVGTFISEQNGWYEIKSGSVTGYVKAEYCVTGENAVELAKKVGTRIAKVTTTTLKVREQPGTDATVLGLVPIADELLVTEELGDWVKVNIEEGDGYVSSDYIALSTEFVKAESKEEEAARLAKEEAERKAAQAAAAAAKAAANKNKSSSKAAEPIVYATGGGSALGNDVVNYACQFIGNPYVFGGSSLTNGTDCSGFVMSVYKNFGVNLPHSSSADRSVGTAVDGLANAQPGDIVCYSGHVGIYAGNGQIVHASTSKTGIIMSNASYRSILSIRRIF